jgi:hypothetical protein
MIALYVIFSLAGISLWGGPVVLIVHACLHIGLHMCHHFIGSKFAHFSTNVNSVNFDINLYISFLGIVRHFIIDKFSVLQPVIASWCANNFDIFYTVCDGFKFDVNNYFNYFL